MNQRQHLVSQTQIVGSQRSVVSKVCPWSAAQAEENMLLLIFLDPQIYWKKGEDPHPQDKIQQIWTLLRTPGRFTTRPLPVYSFSTKMSVVRPFSVLSKDEIGP